MQTMDNGVKRLAEDPAHVFHDTRYRGINKATNDKFMHENFKLGAVYRDKTFVCASQDMSVVSGFFTTLSVKNDKARDVASRYQKSPFLEIESHSAVRIKALSMSRDDQEGLFPLSTPFRVTGKAKTDSDRWHKKLQEIEKTRSSS